MSQSSSTTGKRVNKKRASHDPMYPARFIDFMMQGWKAPLGRMPARVANLARYEARRQALSKAFPGDILIVPTGHEKVRANDTHYRFRPGTDFFYLTGNSEPDCVLVLWPRRRGGGHEHVLYVEPNPGRSDPSFFSDRHKGELWVGPRLGVTQSKHRYGVDRCAPIAELPLLLQRLRSRSQPYRMVRGLDEALEAHLPKAKRADADQALAVHLSEMRLIKDSTEIAALTQACAATRRGFEDIIAQLPRAKTERDVEGAFCTRARRDGNDVGYNVIAAAGAHACVLHWHHNDGALRRGDLVLVDAGVESHVLHTADITRTLPIKGTFSKAQRDIYDLVVAAQHAAFRAIKPGQRFMASYDAAMQILAHGLVRLGILPMPAAEALLPENQFFKRYTLHGVSHMLGMDVHDCASARPEKYRNAILQPGMVLTVEPGLYFQNDDLTVPLKYRGIGIRIEDDVVVTKTGCRILSQDIPRTSHDVEAWMARIWAKR